MKAVSAFTASTTKFHSSTSLHSLHSCGGAELCRPSLESFMLETTNPTNLASSTTTTAFESVSSLPDFKQLNDLFDLSSHVQTKSLARTLNVDPPSQEFVSTMPRPKIVGHRGSMYQKLENTRQSFLQCARDGCDGVELDVYLLKCNTLVVFHGGGSDESPGCLRKHCNIEGSILDFSYEECSKFKFNPYYPEFACGCDFITNHPHECRIPKLQDVLMDMKPTGLTVKIELKGEGTVEPVLELVERLDMVDQCQYSSFKHHLIARVRELRPQKKEDGSYVYKTGALFKDVDGEDFITQANKVGASEVHLMYRQCTSERVAAVHEAGMDSMAWMCGPIRVNEDLANRFYDVEDEDEAMYQLLVATGVRSLCVNKPDVLINMLQ